MDGAGAIGLTTGGDDPFTGGDLSPFNMKATDAVFGRESGVKISAIGQSDLMRKDSPFWDGGDNIFELHSHALYGKGGGRGAHNAAAAAIAQMKEDFSVDEDFLK